MPIVHMNGQMEAHFRALMELIGEDPDREGLRETPKRATEALRFFTKGYNQDVKAVLNNAIFEESYDDMVIVRDIEFYSLCEHHLVPFFGKCHVGYLPAGKIVGLSKIARLVEMYSRRLQVQERLTHDIAHALEAAIQPRGVAVVMQARHLCMMMRGVEKQSSQMVTSAVLGAFRERDRTRDEFMSLLRAECP
jgi:GTP cyclohydrolase I